MTAPARAPARARWAGRGLIGVIALVMALDAVTVLRGCALLRPVKPGDPAPDLHLPRIEAGGRIGPDTVSLSSYRGRVTVLDFWATWCGPCRESMPTVERVVEAQPGEPAALLSVCVDGRERPKQARQLADELAPRADVVADSGKAANLYGVSTIPHILVIDPEGRVVWTVRGFPGSDALADQLNRALAAARGD